jgi:hypothetical protein
LGFITKKEKFLIFSKKAPPVRLRNTGGAEL